MWRSWFKWDRQTPHPIQGSLGHDCTKLLFFSCSEYPRRDDSPAADSMYRTCEGPHDTIPRILSYTHLKDSRVRVQGQTKKRKRGGVNAFPPEFPFLSCVNLGFSIPSDQIFARPPCLYLLLTVVIVLSSGLGQAYACGYRNDHSLQCRGGGSRDNGYTVRTGE